MLNQIKCAAPSVCEKLVASALSGIQLQAVDPQALPIQLPSTSCVFLIKLKSCEQAAICQEKGLAAFVPQRLAFSRLSILSVKESV